MASISDLARHANVSTTTVSRVLNNSPHPVSAATRARVLRAAKELNYRPNALARAMITQRTRIVGVIVGDSSDPYFSTVLRGIENTARDSDYLVIICNSDRDPKVEHNYLSLLHDYRVDGLIFAGGSLQDGEARSWIEADLEALRESNVAMVALNPHIFLQTEVQIDNVAAAREMTEYLLQLGHRRIAFIEGPDNVTTSALRRQGYVEALEAAGIAPDPELIWPGAFTFEGGVQAADRYVSAERKPTAIFASNDQTAIGVVAGLRQADISVPQDVSVAGFDDIQSARYAVPALTTIEVPMYELGAEGMRKVLAVLDGEAVDDVTWLPHRLIVRQSTEPPRASSI